MKITNFFLIPLVLLLTTSCKDSITNTKNTDNGSVYLADPIPNSQLAKSIPELAFYKHRLEKALTQDPPILCFNEKEMYSSEAFHAQQIALRDTHFTRDVYHRVSKKPVRTEIMNVRKTMPADFNKAEDVCSNENCYRVELYNYFYNSTSVAIVDANLEKVISVNHLIGGQATINDQLSKIALAISLNSPEVTMALGFNPKKKDALMANVPTSLNGTKCERSRHLCVAPTFVIKDRALWTIVDLTDWKLVGLRWTDLGKPNKSTSITERSIRNEFIMKTYCDNENELSKSDWKITHRLTSSDGLEIIDVKYKNKPVIKSAKIVDWHVSYSFEEGFGYNDAMGCPMFSTAAVVAFNAPFTEEIKKGNEIVGFALIQDFRSAVWPEPCNYRYQNRFEFYNDGSFRIAGVQLGRGCGVTGMYRPIFRIHLASTTHKFAQFEQWKDDEWDIWSEESWHLQTNKTSYNDKGHLFKLAIDHDHGYYIEPNNGQFNDGGQSDNAYTYVTVAKKNEGAQNMVSFGSCCATDYRQGPENYISPNEGILDKDLVIWYVPQMPNNNISGQEYCWAETSIKEGKAYVKTWPGIAGPKFIPY